MPSDIHIFGQLYTPAARGLAVVTLAGGRVASIEPVRRAPKGTLGGPSFRIVPGLIDIQINGAFGQDFSDPSADLSLVAQSLPRFGLTGFLPTVISSPPERYARCLANLSRAIDAGGAEPLGVHIEGPYLSVARRGTHDPAVLRDPAWREVARWLREARVRIVTLAPERPGALGLVRALAGDRVVVSIGHTDATWAEALAAVEAGATLATHLFNGMRPFSHRDPGVAGFLLAADIATSFIADGVHLAPETLELICRTKRPRDLVLITDALAGLGLAEGAFELAGQQLVRDGAVARRLDGTLSGSLLPLNRALANLVRIGVPEAIAIAAATANPARVIGERGRGVIRPGARADVALLDADWNVAGTWVDGSQVFGAGSAAG